jgi:hypothetical protein
VVWFGSVRFGRYGEVWYGVVWYGVVWYGRVGFGRYGVIFSGASCDDPRMGILRMNRGCPAFLILLGF